jgi:hypothetical protein
MPIAAEGGWVVLLRLSRLGDIRFFFSFFLTSEVKPQVY